MTASNLEPFNIIYQTVALATALAHTQTRTHTQISCGVVINISINKGYLVLTPYSLIKRYVHEIQNAWL